MVRLARLSFYFLFSVFALVSKVSAAAGPIHNVYGPQLGHKSCESNSFSEPFASSSDTPESPASAAIRRLFSVAAEQQSSSRSSS